MGELWKIWKRRDRETERQRDREKERRRDKETLRIHLSVPPSLRLSFSPSLKRRRHEIRPQHGLARDARVVAAAGALLSLRRHRRRLHRQPALTGTEDEGCDWARGAGDVCV